MFYTKSVRPERCKEVNAGPPLVERSGYVPAKVRIENMMLAGQRLVESRNVRYDFDGDVDEYFDDPTRSPGFDMADASQMMEAEKLRS